MNEPSWGKASNDDVWRKLAFYVVGAVITIAVVHALAGYIQRQIALDAIDRIARVSGQVATTAGQSFEAAQRSMETRARIAQAEADRQRAMVEGKRAQADLLERQREAAERQAKAKEAAARQRDEEEGRYFPAAASDMKPNTWACKDGEIVRRTVEGWQVAIDGQGNPGRCRTEP